MTPPSATTPTPPHRGIRDGEESVIKLAVAKPVAEPDRAAFQHSAALQRHRLDGSAQRRHRKADGQGTRRHGDRDRERPAEQRENTSARRDHLARCFSFTYLLNAARRRCETGPGLPPALDRVVLRGLERDPRRRWRDLDAFGHANNAVSLNYLEEVRDEWVERVLAGHGSAWDFVLARVAIDFRRELTERHEWIIASCRVTRVGRSSIHTREEVRTTDGELSAEAESVLVARDPDSGGSRPLSGGSGSATATWRQGTAG